MESKSREFTIKVNGQDTTVFFVRPTVSELMQIDMEYRRIYSEAVRTGIMAEAEARKIFRKSGAWDKSDEDKISNLSLAVAQSLAQLTDKLSSEEGVKLATQINTMRGELMGLIGQRIELFANTAEGIANENRIHKLIELCCVRADTKEKFFDSRDGYELFVQSNKDTLSSIFREAYAFEYGQVEEAMAEWPEVKYLRNLADVEAKKEAAKKEEEKETSLPEEKPIEIVAPTKRKVKKGE
jgi:hypothetical protein